MKGGRLCIVATLMLTLGPVGSPAQFGRGSRTVTFRGANGRTITALQLEPSQRPAPAVILVPMAGRPKEDWQQVAERLVDANITAFAIDLPGTALPPEPGELTAWRTVVTASVDYLFSRPEVRGGSIGVAGASLGANLAAAAAATDMRIQALALVSPSLDYRGVRIEAAMRQYGQRPALLLASLKDPYAARSVRTLASGAPGPREVHLAETAAHGTVLLARDPDLTRLLVEWFQRTLAVN